MTINTFTKEQHTDVLASFVPVGRSYEAAFVEASGLRRYLAASSNEFKRLQDLIATFLEQLDPVTTENFISEWENALGIPDSCIPIAATDDERRDNIVLKLNALSVQTEADFIALAAAFGFTITFIEPAFPPYNVPFTPTSPVGSFPPYDVPFTPTSAPGGTFSWIIQGDFDTDPAKADIFQCLARLLATAGYRVVFIITP